ncbi:MAG: 50S ribosomal protein L4 [Planctomycetota bacterium]
MADAVETAAEPAGPWVAVDQQFDLPVVDEAGKSGGKYAFASGDLAPGINKQLLHDAVVMYLANKRVGTVRTKSRGMVAGSTRKMFRQKGTGNARIGNKRTNKRVGGGVAFGKVPRDFSYRMPKKQIRLATKVALLSKFVDEQAVVLSGLSVDGPKTKAIVAMLDAVGLAGKSTLLVTADYDRTVWLSGRNIAGLQILPAGDLNAYDLLHQHRLLITTGALDRVLGRAEAEAA